MRLILTLAAAATALTATIGMAQTPQQRFTHDGRTYAYTRTDLGDGRQVIEGRSLPGDKPFRLVVRGKRVSGTVGNVPVGFRTVEAQGAAGGVDIGAR
jgi:hypothetical protein